MAQKNNRSNQKLPREIYAKVQINYKSKGINDKLW